MRWLLVIVLSITVLVGTSQRVQAYGTFGPLHRYLYATAPYPEWQDAVIHCESEWNSGAYSWAGAMGIAQFMPSTWAWGEELYGIYGSPYDPYTAIDMMNAFFRDGYAYMWDCA